MEYKTGQILLFRWDNIYSKIVQFGNLVHYKERGWSHAGIIVKVNSGSVIVYEALASGFVESEYGKGELESYRLKGLCRVGESNIKLVNVKKNADKYLGAPYGWLDIFHIFLYYIFGKKSFIFSTKSKRLICSEAVARILYDSSNKKLNFEKEFNKKYDLITPQDLSKSKYFKWSRNIEKK